MIRNNLQRIAAATFFSVVFFQETWAGSRDSDVDVIFYSVSAVNSQQLNDSLNEYVAGDEDKPTAGDKYRSSCRIRGQQVLRFGYVLDGASLKNELKKADVEKAIAKDSKALAKVMRSLAKPRETGAVDLPHGVDQLIAYAVLPNGHVKFWGISPGDSRFLEAESAGQTLGEIAQPLCTIAGTLGLNHD